MGADASAREGITIDDLVRRAGIPLAALSADGRFAAYLVLRGDPVRDVYEATVRLQELRNQARPVDLNVYELTPSATFDETGNFQPSAGGLRWTPQGELLYLTSAAGKMQLVSFHPRTRRAQVLLDGHDRIAFDGEGILTTDFDNRSPQLERNVPDNAWRIQDNYRFHGPFRNPKKGPRIALQRWTITLEPAAPLKPEGKAWQQWAILPDEWQEPPADRLTHESSGAGYLRDRTPSPDGKLIAAVEEVAVTPGGADTTYSTSRIVVMRGNQKTNLTWLERPRPRLTLLGWSPDGKKIAYMHVDAHESGVRTVTLNGKVDERYQETAELIRPCLHETSLCQALSSDGRFALLIRSTNVIPAQLISVDLSSGTMNVLESPNGIFAERAPPSVRFYRIQAAGGEAHGRLYLPANPEVGVRYPLVITQYVSGPGFNTGVGDEVPVLSLTAYGIAVFVMHSLALNEPSETGDFQMEIARVRRPLEAMEWICRKLAAEGIIDPDRIGLTGLSYGAEIAMYAYWHSKLFQAVSTATGSWDPALMVFGGLGYGSHLESRGFPLGYDEAALRPWRELAAGLNASPDLPPLLIQSPDGETPLTVPTWFRLRRVDASVEFYEYPNEGHVKRSPANKWWVYERNLAWFRFWLKSEEDSDPKKRERYMRWRQWSK